MPEGLLEFLEKVLIVAQIIIGLGLLIFIHEAGHFLMAKRHKVKVEAFSLGMGPILWKRTWGETEYRISAIPLGGYVKMAGENIGDPKTGAPDELTSKSAWARFQIFAAGAIMNLVIAFPIAIVACFAGRSEGSPVIGSPSIADTIAGLQPGDRILEADGRKVQSTDEYRKIMVRLPQGRSVTVVVDRGGAEVTCQVQVMESKKHFTLPPPTTFAKIKPRSAAYEAGLRKYAEILEINDEPPRFDPKELRDQISSGASPGPLELRIRNPGEGERRIVLKDLPRQTEEWIPASFRILEPVIDQPVPGSPAAEAGLRSGDVIVRIANKNIASFQDLFDVVGSLGGQKVSIEFKRAGAPQTATALIRYKSQGKGFLGVVPGRSPLIVHVDEGSPFHQAGLQAGDVLLSIEGLPGPATVDIASGRLGPVKVTVRRGEETRDCVVKGAKRERLNFELAGFQTDKGSLAIMFNRIQRTWGFSDGIAAGLREPIDVIDITFRVLAKLFVREEDPGGLAGPVGIFKASFGHAETGIGNFLWLLVLITVNLGIFNLLPVPVLDGGHILLLVIEKVKGSPPSPRFVERFQLVGLVLLLSLLVFVTVNDVRSAL